MAFQVSPGVEVKEIEATGVVPAVSSSIGGFAGAFNWGPVDSIQLVNSEKELAEKFGSPDSNTAKYFLVAASFLKYGNALKVVRTVGSGADNATSDGTGLLIKNEEHYENNYAGGSQSSLGPWAAKYAGVLGNSIQVELCSNATAFSSWSHAGNFDSAPGTSEYAEDLGFSSSNDELHIVVIDKDGAITGTAGTVLETFAFLSQASDAKKGDGTTNFYKEVINSKSEYIWWLGHESSLTQAGNTVSTQSSFTTSDTILNNTNAALSGATDANTGVAADINAGLELFNDAETVDVSLLFGAPDADGEVTVAQKLCDIASARKDCMAFVSPNIADSVGSSDPDGDVVAFVTSLSRSTSYAAVDSGAVYVYDKYNDVYRWIGAAGHQSGLCANADNVADAWFSPAGVNRGQLLGVTKLAYNPKKAERDALYKSRVNPLVSLPGQGTILFGDKTLLSRPSAFDRINVRRLFIVLEKAISTAAKAQLFEFNDEFTRAQFRNLVEPFLRDVKGRRGLTDFSVICDESNNTNQVIDANNFVADIFIKPSRSINFITLNFVATRSGVEFSEISGS